MIEVSAGLGFRHQWATRYLSTRLTPAAVSVVLTLFGTPFDGRMTHLPQLACCQKFRRWLLFSVEVNT